MNYMSHGYDVNFVYSAQQTMNHKYKIHWTQYDWFIYWHLQEIYRKKVSFFLLISASSDHMCQHGVCKQSLTRDSACCGKPLGLWPITEQGRPVNQLWNFWLFFKFCDQITHHLAKISSIWPYHTIHMIFIHLCAKYCTPSLDITWVILNYLVNLAGTQ